MLRCSLASTGLFESTIPSPRRPPSRVPCPVDPRRLKSAPAVAASHGHLRVCHRSGSLVAARRLRARALWWHLKHAVDSERPLLTANRVPVSSFVAVPLVCAPFCGSTSGGGSCTSLPSRGNLSTSRPALSCDPCPVLPYASGSNASGFAAVAFSALLGTSSLGQGWCSAHNRQRSPYSCVSMPEGSTSLASASTTIHASPRLSGSLRLPERTGESVNANTPLISPGLLRASRAGSSFKRSGRRLVARHSEAVPSLGGFSRARVANGDGTGGEGEGVRNFERLMG